MSILLPTFTPSPNAGTLRDALAALRREIEATDSDEQRASLLYEAGILEDLARNETQAARDLLGAVNERPDFLEPLERLISIIDRRKSYKNLGKLLERLSKVVTDPFERSRALLSRAAFTADHTEDVAEVRIFLEEAQLANPEDSTPWLSLEILAAKTHDHALRLRALRARAELAQNPTWRALLWLDVAEELESDAPEEALAAIERALTDGSAARYAATERLERLARRLGRADLLARALETRAALIARHLEGANEPMGVPVGMRTEEHVADTWGRAATARRRSGDLGSAVTFVERARTLLPDEPTLLVSRLRLAEFAGDTSAAAQLAREEIGRGVNGPAAAALWLRVAESAAANSDHEGAMEALANALREDPRCAPARALQLDLLGGSGQGAALAAAFEEIARLASTPSSRSRTLLIAADVWAREARDAAAAERVLAQAAESGLNPLLAGWLGRSLAAIIEDKPWFERATLNLCNLPGGSGETAGLWFEIARARFLRGEVDPGREALASLRESDSGAWLGAALSAYLPAANGSRPDALDALRNLAQLANDPDVSRAYRVAASVRARLAGDVEGALADLGALHSANESDVLAAATFATLLRSSGQNARAAHVLATCGDLVDEPFLAATLGLEAGILEWLSGHRENAVARLTRASEKAPRSGASVLAWALRAAHPNDLDARRKALDATASNAGAVALERFGLEVGRGGDPLAAAEALELVGTDAALAVVHELTQALWTTEGSDRTQRAAALEAMSTRSPPVAALAFSSMYQLHLSTLSEGSVVDENALQATARQWTEVDTGAGAALEWLSTTLRNRDRPAEVAARRAVAERLSGDSQSAMLASAALVSWLHDGEAPTPLDGADAATLLTNLELAPAGSDPRRRTRALQQLSSEFGEGTTGVAAMLSGYNLLAYGQAAEALETFRSALDEYPDDIALWEGVRAAAELTGDRATVAEACAALGDAVSDDAAGAELWEKAARILIDELDDDGRGQIALGRAVERDVTRFSSFDRLFRMVRAQKDGKRLLELITARLQVAEDPDELAKLFWERARVLRKTGDTAGALQALDNVALLEPDHVGALALTGEIYITQQRFEEAADKLAHLARLAEAPRQQRLMSGIAAVDLYENKVGDIQRALDVLLDLHLAKLSTLPVRERLARAAAKAESWEHATSILEVLMQERETRQGRIDAARLAIAVYRDRLSASARSGPAVARLLNESPDDGEALDLVLTGVLDPEMSRRLLELGRQATLSSLVGAPIDAERVIRIGEIARQLDEPPLRQIALGARVALGVGSEESKEELLQLDRRMASRPQMAIDEAAIRVIRDPDDTGPIANLFSVLAPTLADALGPGLSALGVTKKDRIRPKDGLPVRDEVAAWAGALGLGEFDFYHGGRDPDGIYGVPGEMPTIVVGSSVAAPLGPKHRAELARELLALRLGTSILRHRSIADIAAIVVAACNLGGVQLSAPTYAMLGEFEREIGKRASRRVRKSLPELTTPIASRNEDPSAWVRAATASLDRMATVAVGDVSWVLAEKPAERGQAPFSDEATARTARLLSFVFSPEFVRVREQLGLGVR